VHPVLGLIELAVLPYLVDWHEHVLRGTKGTKSSLSTRLSQSYRRWASVATWVRGRLFKRVGEWVRIEATY
jgi:hypothetical protein